MKSSSSAAAYIRSILSKKYHINCSYWRHSVFHWLVMVVSVQIMIVDSFVSWMHAGIMPIEKSLECLHGSLWKNCSLCVRDWILDIYVHWRNSCFYIRYLDLIIQFLKCAILFIVNLLNLFVCVTNLIMHLIYRFPVLHFHSCNRPRPIYLLSCYVLIGYYCSIFARWRHWIKWITKIRVNMPCSAYTCLDVCKKSFTYLQ